jgi:hypothetical protein
MGTSVESVFDSFYRLIERDLDFFTYQNVPDHEAENIVKERSYRYLDEAISKLLLQGIPEISFGYNQDTESFDEELTRVEINIVAQLMLECHFHRDYSTLKVNQIHFSPKDLQSFSPANERKTFVDMYNGIVSDNRLSLSEYFSRNRLTGALKGIDYSKYQFD